MWARVRVASLKSSGAIILILIWRQITVNSEAQKFLHRLLYLRSKLLRVAEGVVDNLLVIGKDPAHVFQIDLNDVALREDLTDAVSQVLNHTHADSMLNSANSGDALVVGLGERFHDEIPGLTLEDQHLVSVSQAMSLHELLA